MNKLTLNLDDTINIKYLVYKLSRLYWDNKEFKVKDIEKILNDAIKIAKNKL